MQWHVYRDTLHVNTGRRDDWANERAHERALLCYTFATVQLIMHCTTAIHNRSSIPNDAHE